MRKSFLFQSFLAVSIQLYFLAPCHAQSPVPPANSYTVENYQMGAMLVGVRTPGNWNAEPVIIGSISEAGVLNFDWPATLPNDLKKAADQLNYVLNTGNCDPGEDGAMESDEPNYILFNRIWLIHPDTKDVQGQLMAASNDSLRKWMHKPDDEIAVNGTYAYLLYAFQDNALRSACQFESWLTPEGQDEITLNHRFENNVKVQQGFQFVIYNTKEVHPYQGIQPKMQEISASFSLPQTITWKVKE